MYHNPLISVSISDFWVTGTLNRSNWLGRISCQKLNFFVLLFITVSYFAFLYSFGWAVLSLSRCRTGRTAKPSLTSGTDSATTFRWLIWRRTSSRWWSASSWCPPYFSASASPWFDCRKSLNEWLILKRLSCPTSLPASYKCSWELWTRPFCSGNFKSFLS